MLNQAIIQRAKIEAAEKEVIRDLREMEITAAKERGIELVRIWSFEHDAWWRADHCGYTADKDIAGLYPRQEAEDICRRANYGGMLNEEIVEIGRNLKSEIRDLIEEINRQDNRATAHPYYFAVQELEWMPDPEGYAWGSEQREVGVLDDRCYDKESFREILNDLREEDECDLRDEEFEEIWERDKQMQTGMWITKGIFLTEIEANKFIQANAHNLGKTRTYVEHFYRNSQMELVFEALEEFAGTRIRRR